MARALLIAILAACQSPAGPTLQVMGDSYKRPLGEPAPSTSPFFDGRTLRLRGVRGETLGVQVLLARRPAADVSLELPAGVAGVSAFELRTVRVEQPSTEMYGFGLGPGDWPDVLVPAEGAVHTRDQAFFDVAIAPDAPAGPATGRLLVGDDEFPIDLTVEPLSIDLHADPFVWVWYKAATVARQHGAAEDSPEELGWERRYVDLFRAHGAYAATDTAPALRRDFMAGVRFWPIHVDDDVTPEALAALTEATLALFEGTGVTPFAIPIDEPQDDQARRRVVELATIMRAHGAGARFLVGVTDRERPIYGQALDLYLGPANFPSARRPAVHAWTYNGRPPEAGNMIIDTHGTALRTWGWIGYRYDVELWHAWEGLYFWDRYNDGGPSDPMRDPLSFDQRRNARMTGPRDWGNGEGLLAYPGALPSLRLKALRRGLQDRLLLRKLAGCGGAAEADALARRMVPAALGEGRGPAGAHAWPDDEAAWEAARAELLDRLLARCPHET